MNNFVHLLSCGSGHRRFNFKVGGLLQYNRTRSIIKSRENVCNYNSIRFPLLISTRTNSRFCLAPIVQYVLYYIAIIIIIIRTKYCVSLFLDATNLLKHRYRFDYNIQFIGLLVIPVPCYCTYLIFFSTYF